MPEVDRLLALALTEYEARRCSGCGQDLHESMDPDLLDEWDTWPAIRCGSCTALARAAERTKDSDHPQALHHAVGLRHGWEERKAALVAERVSRGED